MLGRGSWVYGSWVWVLGMGLGMGMGMGVSVNVQSMWWPSPVVGPNDPMTDPMTQWLAGE